MSERDRNMIEFGLTLRRELPDVPHYVLLDTAARLSGIARRLHTMSETACNYGLSDAQEKSYDKLIEKAEKLAKDDLNTTIVFNGDPRGAPLYLVVPSGYTDDWGKRGITIPY
jgi:hypothetical protein